MLAGLIDVIHWLEDVFGRLQLRRSYGGAIAYNYYAPPGTAPAEPRLQGKAQQELRPPKGDSRQGAETGVKNGR